MPTTLLSLIIFVCFVTPGFVFEMLRERRRPQRNHTTLRETSIIVISSVAFSLPAAFLVLLTLPPASRVVQGLADSPSKYAAAHLAGVVALIGGTVALAIVFGVIWDCILQLRQKRPLVTKEPVWYEVLNGRAAPDNKNAVAILSVELKNGAMVQGEVKAHGLNKDLETDWIVLQSNPKWPLASRSLGGVVVAEEWDYLVITADEIRASYVSYLEP